MKLVLRTSSIYICFSMTYAKSLAIPDADETVAQHMIAGSYAFEGLCSNDTCTRFWTQRMHFLMSLAHLCTLGGSPSAAPVTTRHTIGRPDAIYMLRSVGTCECHYADWHQ